MPMIVQDHRARLQPKNPMFAESILGPNDPANLLYPLYATNGVLFPYTPSVTSGSTAEYETMPFVHSNYTLNSYVRSYPKAISITAEFTAQSNDEAMYLLAVIHFFRSVTKTYFGVTPYKKAGTPPPVLQFNYLGEYQFSNVPVIVKDVGYTYPNNIDYVPINTTNKVINFKENGKPGNLIGMSWVPAQMTITIELDTQYTPMKVRDQFNLDAFRRGLLIGDGYI
jgi:hypothetical protein